MIARSKYLLLLLAACSLGGCSLGPTELLIILVIVVLLFGATRLPALGRALGDTVKSFRDSTKEALDDKKRSDERKDSEAVRIEEAKVERDEKKND
ncbi:MAG: twin-arginine translocase TatA/TatE family subunit [Deltaproteobacteria bacterium]|nr:twin-arginine translocase TatA/TatE family subunit [Deltaproteobacteria bacterium]